MSVQKFKGRENLSDWGRHSKPWGEPKQSYRDRNTPGQFGKQ